MMKEQKIEELDHEALQAIIIKGDLSALSSNQKIFYMHTICEMLGLNILTLPLRYLRIEGREILYCTKAGAEQLNERYDVSHEIRDRRSEGGVYTVLSRASFPSGRFVDSTGCVSMKGLEGEVLANAMMTAETKSKRRATLSLLGLGMLSEEEVWTIPGAAQTSPLAVPDAQVTVGEKVGEQVSEMRFPFGPYKNQTLAEIYAKCGWRQIERAAAWCSKHAMHAEFVRQAKTFLEKIIRQDTDAQPAATSAQRSSPVEPPDE